MAYVFFFVFLCWLQHHSSDFLRLAGWKAQLPNFALLLRSNVLERQQGTRVGRDDQKELLITDIYQWVEG
jgi:hypothetical protein